MDVERDGRFPAFSRIGLVEGDTPQQFRVIRLVEGVGERRDGHPRFDLADVGRVGLVVLADEFALVEEPLDVGGRVPAAAQTADRGLFARRQCQITTVGDWAQFHFQLRRARWNCVVVFPRQSGTKRKEKKRKEKCEYRRKRPFGIIINVGR